MLAEFLRNYAHANVKTAISKPPEAGTGTDLSILQG